MLRGSVHRLDGFIKDILDYSKNSRTEIKCDKINWRELIENAHHNLVHMNGNDKHKVTIEIGNGVTTYSDKNRLEIILNNLFSNSFKYADHNKQHSFILIRVFASQGATLLVFSDNGIGIEEIHQNKIFDMFYRASEISKGSGLGLYIVKEMVTKIKGEIRMKSKLGISTTFEITIPNLTPTNGKP